MDPDGPGELEEEVSGSFTFTRGLEDDRPRKGKRNRKRDI